LALSTPLPTTQFNHFSGYYPHNDALVPVDEDNHNLYEEIPSLGVFAEQIRIASNQAHREANLNPIL
jgi:hypothetical protein